MLQTERRQATTCTPDFWAADRNVFMTLCPRKSVSRISSSVPEGNCKVFF